MGMLDKLKDMAEMRKSAKELQSVLGKETVSGASSNGSVKVVLDGNQNVVSVQIADSALANKELLERSTKEAFSRALDALKKLMVSKFSSYMK
ncbi:YbaB/EbfC family nucleoid-associated protein [Candidatus Uhrbacteria bacterium]|nr:YbaB/EbfC family nucleoid-associated protein [Candidatus Uhrbacteria bacterium]